jgi:hypothetical protein
MQRDPKKTWKRFAEALTREEDAEKFRQLTQQFYDALAQDDELQNPRPSDAASD